MAKKITDFINKKQDEQTVLIQARVPASLKKLVVDKMKREGVPTMKDLVEACLRSFLTETVKK